jgi:microcystin-dependent protein
MPSTYTTNLGVEKPGSGEQSGTWGGTVNDNMDIVDRAINGAVSLTLVGATSTLTTSEGTLSDGQNKFLRLSGSPGGTHTITVSPNDAQKVYFVTNGSNQSAVFSQGSGANVTVLAGDAAVIYCNGAGAGAAVLSMLDALAMGAVRITGGTITGITDLAVADGGTGASTAAAALINLDLTATAAELNILDGVTASTAELNHVDGVTSGIQTQLDAKAPLASPALTGNPTAPTQTPLNNSTRVATTAYTDAAVAAIPAADPFPAGAVAQFAMNTAPSGWLKANGALVSRATYAALFTAIGTTFGVGDGSTTFGLPDLRGEFVRGWDDGRGVDTARAFGSAQDDLLETHTHTGTAASAGAHTHTVAINGSGDNGGSQSSASASKENPGNYTTSSAGAHTHSVTVDATGGAETRPRNVALLFCIKH